MTDHEETPPLTEEQQTAERIKSLEFEVHQLAKALGEALEAMMELTKMLPEWAFQVSRSTAETIITARLGGYPVPQGGME
jgi:hypothetical protein